MKIAERRMKIGVALHGKLGSKESWVEQAQRIRKTGHPVAVWGGYSSEDEMQFNAHFRTQQVQEYFSSCWRSNDAV